MKVNLLFFFSFLLNSFQHHLFENENMSYQEENESGSDHDFGDLFGSEDEASDIDDQRSSSSVEEQQQQQQPQSPTNATTATMKSPPASQKSNDLDNLFGSDDESDSEQEVEKRQTLKQRR